jgi:Tfp pilus assembly protein PilX
VRAIASRLGWPTDERGSVTVLVVMSMTALLALLALGIDLGGLFTARSEAQRAADAAALAGASAFLEYQESQAHQIAVERAVDFATNNTIRNAPILAEDVSIWVDTEAATVRAAVRRDGVSTWFARLFGVDAVDVGAEATAWAAEAGAATCVKPFAVPDMWEETSDDLNRNRIWDEGEHWSYDPGDGDRYSGYSGAGGAPNETGYGGHWRDGQVDELGRRYDRDYGRRITVKVTNPRDAYVSSFFLPWVLPADGDQGECHMRNGGGNGGGGNGGGHGGGSGNGNGGGDDTGGDLGNPGNGNGRGGGFVNWWEKREDLGNPESGGGGPSPEPGNGTPDVGRDDGDGKGAARYRRNICTCNSSIIDLDTEYLIEPGNMVGPTYQGMQALIAEDPDAYWDEQTNTVVSQYGMDSPRVVTVSLFDPAEIDKPGRQYIRFNNFARVFLEEQVDRQDPVTGRFLFYVPGVGRTASGSTTGSLVRVLQLIR